MNYRERYKKIRRLAATQPDDYWIEKLIAEIEAEQEIDVIPFRAPLTSTGK